MRLWCVYLLISNKYGRGAYKKSYFCQFSYLCISFFPRRDAIISARGAKTVSEDEIIDSFPVEESRSSGRLFNLAISSWGNFIDSHSLEVKFSKESSKAFARALKDEHGKLKKKKKLPLLALALALKALLLAKYALWSHFCKKEGHKHAGIVKYVAPEGAAAAQQTDLPSGTGLAEQYPYNRAYENSQDLPYNAYAVYP